MEVVIKLHETERVRLTPGRALVNQTPGLALRRCRVLALRLEPVPAKAGNTSRITADETARQAIP